jgi:hypothetical protein
MVGILQMEIEPSEQDILRRLVFEVFKGLIWFQKSGQIRIILQSNLTEETHLDG